jgi:hypothetical protein
MRCRNPFIMFSLHQYIDADVLHGHNMIRGPSMIAIVRFAFFGPSIQEEALRHMCVRLICV